MAEENKTVESKDDKTGTGEHHSIKNFQDFIETTRWARNLLFWMVPIILIPGNIWLIVWCWFIKLPPVMALPQEQRDASHSGFFIMAPVISFIIMVLIFSKLAEFRDRSLQTEIEKEREKTLRKQENAFKEALTKTGFDGIINLITYSKGELEVYYHMGLSQQKKSYRNSIIAMWLGFLIIAAGIALYVMPLPYVNKEFLNGNLQIITIGSGVILELISGLFFYMFRESSSKLTYLYNRQRVLYDSLICLQISKEKESTNEFKKMIISNILDRTEYRPVRTSLRKKLTRSNPEKEKTE